MIALIRIRRVFALSVGVGAATVVASARAAGQALHPPINLHGPVKKFPVNPPSQFARPETMTPPFGLQIVNATTIVHTSAFNPSGPTLAHNPSVVFNFPITPDINAYLNGGLHFAYKAVGWKGHIYTEACLTADEVAGWPGAIPKNPDSTTCPTKEDPATQKFIPRTWYQVADATVDLYVVQNQGFILIPPPVPMNLQQIVTPLRFHTNGFTYYYKDNHTGPNDMHLACTGPACSNAQADTYSPPFNMVVLPAALMQGKLLPETIVYMPPGAKSNANLKVTKTFSTTITAGETAQIDNTAVRDDWMELIDQGGFNGDIGKVLDLGFNSTTDTRWDTKTTLKSGQALERDLQGLNQTATAFTRKITADPATIPGAAGPFEKEPFWSDLVVVLAHPQYAVWDFYGRPIVQLIAASSSSGLPNDIAITVGELDACARGAAPFTNGYPFTTATEATDTIRADECKALAGLDPFWGKGQSADLTGRGQLLVASQEYGIPVTGSGSENSLDIQVITSDAETITDQNTTSYASTVEDIVATTSSAGITFGLNTGTVFGPFNFGLSNAVTLKPGSSIDSSLTMTLTYKNSTATTHRTDIQTEGVIDDAVNRGYSPHVEVYEDDNFGSLIFRDPDAVCSPLPGCRAVAPLGPSNQVPRRKKHPVIKPLVPMPRAGSVH